MNLAEASRCNVWTCPEPIRAKEYCSKHYQRLIRRGDVFVAGNRLAVGKADRKDNIDAMNRDIQELWRAAQAQGWQRKSTKDGWMFQSPDGVSQVLVHRGDPSDWRAFENSKQRFKRAGLVFPYTPEPSIAEVTASIVEEEPVPQFEVIEAAAAPAPAPESDIQGQIRAVETTALEMLSALEEVVHSLKGEIGGLKAQIANLEEEIASLKKTAVPADETRRSDFLAAWREWVNR